MFSAYFNIISGKLQPRHFISKRILVDGYDDAKPAVDLLEIHKRYSSLFDNNPNPNKFVEIEGVNDKSLYDLKVLIALKLMAPCILCENRCRAIRLSGKRGRCGVGRDSLYTSEFIHMGEESCIVPSHTIFFSGCTFECIHCQNYDIAREPDQGQIFDENILRAIQRRHKMGGTRNINLVGGNPDQHLPNILRVFKNLDTPIPIVWNSNTYASIETMELLKGFADLHLADFKYGNDKCAKEISGIDNYWNIVTRNLLFAYTNSDILIRHLVLPGHVECCAIPVAKWCAENIPNCGFNLMFQYHPMYKAYTHPVLRNYLGEDDIYNALNSVKKFKLNMV